MIRSLVSTRKHCIRSMSTGPKIIKTVSELRQWRRSQLQNSKSVGFVPTMGALHQGHLNLVTKSLEDNDSTVVSIFVNPSQFAPGEDLDNYPRTFEADLEALRQTFSESQRQYRDDNFTLFLPSVKEMYPNGITIRREEQRGAFVEVLGLTEQLEGAQRPQFFRGVTTVVNKLLNAATPDRAYFGQKDIQQSIVVERMVKDLLIGTEIIVVPTAREPHGLAMSSRNEYVSEEIRQKAKVLYEALLEGEKVYISGNGGSIDRKNILDSVNDTLNKADFPLSVEYVALSDKETLQELDVVTPGKGAVLSGVIRVQNKAGSQTRLLDNIIFN